MHLPSDLGREVRQGYSTSARVYGENPRNLFVHDGVQHRAISTRVLVQCLDDKEKGNFLQWWNKSLLNYWLTTKIYVNAKIEQT